MQKTYQVTGMDCGGCALTIEKAVAKLPGIQSAKVNFSTGKMAVAVADPEVLPTISKTVSQLGYQIAQPVVKNSTQDTFKITGMDCGGCAQTIEKHLGNLPDVQAVTVNFATGSMAITHTNPVVTIQSELAKIGYGGTLVGTAATAKKSAKLDKHTQTVLIAGILLALGYVALMWLPALAPVAFAASMVVSGWQPLRSAFYALKSKSLDMNVLMVAAALGAALIGEWNEGALVVFLFAIGTLLQNKAVEKTRHSIKGLLDLTPDTALVQVGDEFVQRAVSSVQVADILQIQAGAKIPLDGTVIQGTSSVNQAPITGEANPVVKQVDDEVFAGTINQEGALTVKVTHLSSDSTIARIITMVEDAQAQKAPAEAFIDRFAKVYTPIVFALALLTMVIPPLFFQAAFATWFYRGLELLVVACPCALIISTPVAIVSAIGRAAKNGVLIKGGNFLEKAGALTAVAFDKTGTITAGQPAVSGVYPFDTDEQTLVQTLAALEANTTHPIGQAITQAAQAQALTIPAVTDFQNIPGKGIQATLAGTTYLAGTAALFDQTLFTKTHLEQLQTLQASGQTIVLLGTETKLLGLVAVADGIRPTSKQAIAQLANVGIKETVMLTGDNQGAAAKIAQDAGITTVAANLLPDQKVQAIAALQQKGQTVAMVGDGINDAPALALADVGIAMGGAGTDTAIETADIVLMADNLEKLPFMIRLSRQAMGIVKQNVAFALAIKLLAFVLIFPGWLPLWAAVLSDSGAAVLVTLNALRLLRQKPTSNPAQSVATSQQLSAK
jgi:Cd2+/Zn2+-exporting ATPase